jgi:uncharacterized membrane protein (UPF0127 family)
MLDRIVAFPALRAAARALVLAWLALALAAPAWAESAGQAPLRRITVKVAGHALRVEVAETLEQHMRGLMMRERLGRDDGMLFVYEDPGYHAMWMKNTLIPLSVAFIDGNGVILNIVDMEPQTEDTHTAAGPARFAIETNRGWFAGHRIKPGDRVTGLPRPPS